MLTVNIKQKSGESEEIIEATRVVAGHYESEPPRVLGRAVPGYPGVYEYAEIDLPDGSRRVESGVDVYVMNDTGQTVAKYDLPVYGVEAAGTREKGD